MIHAYHVIFGAYGFWLPNDPHGSWSECVASWELVRFGKPDFCAERNDVEYKQWSEWRQKAEKSLKYPAVNWSGVQAAAIGAGFAARVKKCNLTVWACSILPEHVHLVIARHTYRAEQICNLLKGEATRALKSRSLHPQTTFAHETGKLPSAWAERQWKVYLDCDEAIETAIRYVEQNPLKEKLPAQSWSFVSPFGGIPKGGWLTYH